MIIATCLSHVAQLWWFRCFFALFPSSSVFRLHKGRFISFFALFFYFAVIVLHLYRRAALNGFVVAWWHTVWHTINCQESTMNISQIRVGHERNYAPDWLFVLAELLCSWNEYKSVIHSVPSVGLFADVLAICGVGCLFSNRGTCCSLHALIKW